MGPAAEVVVGVAMVELSVWKVFLDVVAEVAVEGVVVAAISEVLLRSKIISSCNEIILLQCPPHNLKDASRTSREIFLLLISEYGTLPPVLLQASLGKYKMK